MATIGFIIFFVGIVIIGHQLENRLKNIEGRLHRIEGKTEYLSDR